MIYRGSLRTVRGGERLALTFEARLSDITPSFINALMKSRHDSIFLLMPEEELSTVVDRVCEWYPSALVSPALWPGVGAGLVIIKAASKTPGLSIASVFPYYILNRGVILWSYEGDQ